MTSLSLGMPITAHRRRGGGVDPFAALMSTLGEGAAQLIAHPLEYGSMFIDRAGTTPVTESGQLVGRVLDAGGGSRHAEAVSDAARGIFRDVGGFRYIEYNGVNTAYKTPVLPAPGVDKFQAFAGARNAGTSAAILAGLATFADNGSFEFFVPVSEGSYRISSKGDGTNRVASVAGFSTPSTNVLTAIGDISAPRVALRVDGFLGSENMLSQGAGNYNPGGLFDLTYGSRGGGSLFFNGRHYATLGPIVRFSAASATAEQIAAAEAYYTARTDL